ncbi:F-box and leucine-rich repeat protein 13 [Microcaecilia unicolor]|uniref:Dynein regulatory complex subunit 6 n=1 Tax=Microcaecilia unicolor TaxID=1415580 RepID=A0A6P7Z703_9AMPH|nr:dynein regulatory complex subunit 6 [Microcaecilia unicolor]
MYSLRNADAQLRNYIIRHALPEIYEALLCGLCIMRPEDPLLFLEEAIKRLMEMEKGQSYLLWDILIDESVRPKIKPTTESYLEYLFGQDEAQLLSPELFVKAYAFYGTNLQRKCFEAWVKYCLRRKNQRADMQHKTALAQQHYNLGQFQLIVLNWNAWVKFRKQQHSQAAAKIQNTFSKAVLRIVLKAWHLEAQDSRKTRVYFERLKRGELEEHHHLQPAPPQDASDEVSQLPLRAALKIFSYVNIVDLARCAQVCQSWKVLTQTSSLWSTINFSAVRQKIQDKTVVNILQKCRPYVVRLNFRHCSLYWPCFKSIGVCRNLQDLNLSECQGVDDESVRVISEGCSALLYLNLSYTDITIGTLRILSRCFQNLQYLSLAYCRKFTDKGLQYLATGKGCRKLIYLDLSGCTQISIEGFRFIADGCSKLQHLKINDMITLTDSCVLPLTEQCQQLTSISLLGSPHLSDIAFKALAQGKKITKIRIEGNNWITDSSLKSFSKHCLHLSHIYVADCQKITDHGLKALASMKNILVLNVADCIRISDPGVRHFLEGSSGLKIRELNLTNCVRISDISLLRIAQRCHSLTYLNLRYCENVTDSGIELLGNMQSLISIDLSGTNISDQGLAALGTRGKIKELIVSECLGITDMGMKKFCQQVKELEQLDVSHCLKVTNRSMKTVAFCCQKLTALGIAGCPKMTDLSIQYISGVCHYLHILDISGCIHLTDRSLKYLWKGCKQLRILKMLYCRSITKSAVSKAEPRVDKLEYSNDDPPPWFGYNQKGKFLNSISENEQNHEAGPNHQDRLLFSAITENV